MAAPLCCEESVARNGPAALSATALPGLQGHIRHTGSVSMDANPNKALWEKGDFTRIARAMRESGETVGRS
ncbi:MAG TPA: hypothetical protein VFV78_10385 [Vicinamibacterales bacterium]|nr:hypothetical protein [Vicinamibacterales bacterium]